MPAASSSAILSAQDQRRTLGVGEIVFGRFTLRRLLGRGGMGTVWLADDVQLDRQVALKFMAEPLFGDASARDELRREARRSLELTHPNIVRTFDYLEDDESAAISLEYVDGSTLARLRVEQPGGIFEPGDLRRWLADCCEALEYAHLHACLVHRDLKPANLMLTSSGVAKIADFGISCGLQNTVARISAWSQRGGTLGYMSPQQLRGDLAAPSDDIYSFGATVYELLTGKPPFYSGDINYQVREVNADLVHQRRAKLGIGGPPIPREWVDTLAACLAKDPAHRPGSIREVADRLGLSPHRRLNMGTAADVDRTLRFAPLHRATPVPQPMTQRTMQRWYMTAILLPVVVGWLLWPEAKLDAPQAHERMPRAEATSEVQAAAAATDQGVNHPASLAADDHLLRTVPLAAEEPVARSASEQNVAPANHPSPVIEPAHTSAALAVETANPAAPVVVEPSQPLQNAPAIEPPALLLTTEPAGVAFQLFAGSVVLPDSKPVQEGMTPALLADVAPGRYQVIFHPGSATPSVHSVEVGFAGVTKVTQELPTAMLEVTSQPPGAAVTVNDRAVGVTPLTLPLAAGDYEVIAELNGRVARPRKVAIADEGSETVRFDFTPSTATRSRSSRTRRAANDSVFTKVGRSIQNLFGGDKKRR